MTRGHNTIGYGKTKAAVIQGHKDGLTLTQIAKKYGITRAAANNCAYRVRLKFPYERIKHAYGTVKPTVMLAAEQGMTIKQIVKTYGYNISTVRNINREFGLNIPQA